MDVGPSVRLLLALGQLVLLGVEPWTRPATYGSGAAIGTRAITTHLICILIQMAQLPERTGSDVAAVSMTLQST